MPLFIFLLALENDLREVEKSWLISACWIWAFSKSKKHWFLKCKKNWEPLVFEAYILSRKQDIDIHKMMLPLQGEKFRYAAQAFKEQ